MGLLDKFSRDAPATTTDHVEEIIGSPPGADIEKSTGEAKIENAVQPRHHHDYPDAEKRVIRKMDLRIPTLVAALCMSSFKP